MIESLKRVFEILPVKKKGEAVAPAGRKKAAARRPQGRSKEKGRIDIKA